MDKNSLTTENNMISSETFVNFFRHSPVVYQVLDSCGRIVDVNFAWEETFGYSRSDIIGKYFCKILTPDSQKLLDKLFSTSLKTGYNNSIILETYSRTRSVVYVALYFRHNYDENGNIISTNCILTDKTNEITSEIERIKDAQNSELLSLQLQTLLDNIPDRIHFLDTNLRVMWTNHKQDMKGEPFRKKPIGEYCYDLLHGRNSPCEDCPVVQCLKTGKKVAYERENPDGRIWARRAFPVFGDDNQIINVVEIGLEITDEARAQRDRLKIGQLAALGELAMGVAHEINNPISGIINYAQLIKNCSTIEEKSNFYSDKIIKEGGRIAKIVNNLLVNSNYGYDNKILFNLPETLYNSIELVGSQLNRDGIEIEVSGEDSIPQMYGNPHQFQQIFINLISNSRYALNKSNYSRDIVRKIEVNFECYDYDSRSEIVVRLKDNGIGIPKDLLGKILQPFVTSKPSSDGAGLGLYITKEIIYNHGGSIEFSSETNKFTEVVIRLPV